MSELGIFFAIATGLWVLQGVLSGRTAPSGPHPSSGGAAQSTPFFQEFLKQLQAEADKPRQGQVRAQAPPPPPRVEVRPVARPASPPPRGLSGLRSHHIDDKVKNRHLERGVAAEDPPEASAPDEQEAIPVGRSPGRPSAAPVARLVSRADPLAFAPGLSPTQRAIVLAELLGGERF